MIFRRRFFFRFNLICAVALVICNELKAQDSSPPPGTPEITITGVDVCGDQINFEIKPDNTPTGEVTIVIHGTSDIEMVKKELSGGSHAEKFDWSKFPQAPGEIFTATGVEVVWKRGKASAKYDVSFTGYGVFRISKYVTPDDEQWTGPVELVSFNSNGTPPFREVHSSWIQRVRGQEGVGLSQGEVFSIRTTQSKTVRNYLVRQDEGAYVERLTVNFSLAKHRSDGRFNPHDSIVLGSDGGRCFAIEDTGNWSGGNNHLDRFGGVVGPNDPNTDFPSCYVVKISGQ